MDQEDEFRFSPWDVRSLYELQVYDCPVCVFQDWSKQSFVNHAVQNHPESVQYLSNILDDSLIDVDCPWNKSTDDDKKPFEDPLVDHFFDIEYQDDENYPEDSAIEPDKPKIDQIKSEELDVAPILKECFVLLEPLDPKYFGEKFLQSKTMPTIKVKPITNESVQTKVNPSESETSPIIKPISNDNIEENVETKVDIPTPKWNKTSKQSSEDAHNMKCSYCSRTFETFKLLIMHLEETHNDIVYCCLSCEIFFAYSRAKLEHTKHCSEKYKCCICGLELGIQNSLRKHIRGFHRNSLPSHGCNQCHKSYESEARLKAHIEIDHDKVDLAIPCGDCGKTFRHQRLLRKHTNRFHKKVPKVSKPMKCDDCLVPLRSFKSQELHDRNCQTLQQKICDHCGQQFEELAKLLLHRNYAHSELLECDICGKTMSTNSALRRHTRIFHDHIVGIEMGFPIAEPLIEMVECEICKSKFVSQKMLRAHKKKYHNLNVDLQPAGKVSLQTYEDSKEMKCTYCSSKFETKKLLILHLEEAHDDVVYACLSHDIIFQAAKGKYLNISFQCNNQEKNIFIFQINIFICKLVMKDTIVLYVIK